MFLRKSLFGILGVFLACGTVAFTQEPQTPSSQDDSFRREKLERMERRRERLGRGEEMRRKDGMSRRGPGINHLTRELNLTDEQRQQSQAILQRRLEGIKPQREELLKLREKRVAGTFSAEDGAQAKALHHEIRAAMQGMTTEMAGVLTAEQKTRLEQLKKERRERHEQKKLERQERLNQNPQ